MTRNLLATALLILVFLKIEPASSATINVPSQYPSLESALEAVQSGDVITLEPGIYFEADLILHEGITISGAGIHPNEVIIDAQQLGRVMLAEGLNQKTTVENITFRNGRASGETSYDQSGGAVFCSNSLLRIINCIFTNNRADSHGGALRCTNSSPEIIGCTFSVNAAPAGGGGAIDCSYGAYPLVSDCMFVNNTADWGAALSCRADSSPKIDGVTFDSNVAQGDRSFGGAIFADYQAKPNVSKSVFCDNVALYGGAITCFENAEINLNGCTIVGNESLGEGGAMYLRGASPDIIGTIISFNEGTAITTAGQADPKISCTDIFGNTLGDWDGSFSDQLYVDGNMSVDPLFCSLIAGDDSRFFLQDNSPLALPESGCDTMGALEIGCASISHADPVPHPMAMSSVSAYPNPFNPTTIIQFDLEQAQRVRVDVFNLHGSLVRNLSDEELPSGAHSIQWNGKDNGGRTMGSGAYIVVVESALDRHTKKLTMLK